MKPPVRLHGPTFLLTEGNLLQEVIPSLILRLILLQRCTQVTHVLRCAELRNPREQHERKECDKQPRLRAQGQIGIDTGVLKEGTNATRFTAGTCREIEGRTYIFLASSNLKLCD